MGLATQETSGAVIGCFTEKDCGNVYEFILNDEMFLNPLAHGGPNVRFPHKVFVGPLGETRHAHVKGTVVHIVTEETQSDGETWFVVEKWEIKKKLKYK